MRLGRRLAGARAVRLADRREQQVQVAGDVGHRADGRARVVGERLLLDRDHRRQAEHEVHVRLGHLRDEPLGVARQRLHVAPLPLGVDGVEGQARLARAREPGDDDQLSRGISSEMFFRLCTRAPCTAIVVRGAAWPVVGGGQRHGAGLGGARARVTRLPSAGSGWRALFGSSSRVGRRPAGGKNASSCTVDVAPLRQPDAASTPCRCSPWSARYSQAVGHALDVEVAL